jgi:hypothetical protein
MRRIPVPLEFIFHVMLFVIGSYMLYLGISGQQMLLLIAGALCCVLGLLALGFAIRAMLWHRQMLRESVLRQQMDLE